MANFFFNDYWLSAVAVVLTGTKINEKHYESLRKEISLLYEKIFRKRIAHALDSSRPINKKATQEQLTEIKNEADYASSEGKINEKHYELLSKAISKLDNKE